MVYTRRLDQAFYSPLISLDNIDILSDSHTHSWGATSIANSHWEQGCDSPEMTGNGISLTGNAHGLYKAIRTGILLTVHFASQYRHSQRVTSTLMGSQIKC